LPANAGEDSVTLLSLLRGETSRTPRPALVHHSENGSFAIRSGKWKLLLCPGSGGWSYPTTSPAPWGRPVADKVDHLPPFQLYDISTDLAEKNNLAAAHPEIVRELGAKLAAYIKNGRSTPGAPQPVEWGAAWPQIEWMKTFAP
jgi:arylsulfatase A